MGECKYCNDNTEYPENAWFVALDVDCEFDTCTDWRGTEFQAQKGKCPEDWRVTVCPSGKGGESWHCGVCETRGPDAKEWVAEDCNWQFCEDEEGNWFNAPESCPTDYEVHVCITEDKVEHWDAKRCDINGDYYLSYPECPWNLEDGWADRGMCYLPTEEEMTQPEVEILEEEPEEVEPEKLEVVEEVKEVEWEE